MCINTILFEYDRNHALWFSTYHRGHLSRRDLETCKKEDFGQIGAIESWRIMGGKEPVFSNMQPAFVAISNYGERVAVIVADELGCFYVFKSVNIIPSSVGS